MPVIFRRYWQAGRGSRAASASAWRSSRASSSPGGGSGDERPRRGHDRALFAARISPPISCRRAVAIHVVLVHPEIHWNTGNAGRTCLAAGATLHLVEPLGFSLEEKQVKRAGLDYWEHVDLRVWPEWDAFETALPALGEPYFFSTKATKILWEAPLGTAQEWC